MRTSSKLNFPNVPSYLIERSHRADLDVASKILQGRNKDVPRQNQSCCSQDISNDSKPTFGSGPSFTRSFSSLSLCEKSFAPAGMGCSLSRRASASSQPQFSRQRFRLLSPRELWRGLDCLTPARLDCLRMDVREPETVRLPSSKHPILVRMRSTPYKYEQSAAILGVSPKNIQQCCRSTERQGKAMCLALR
jgi:hypothetical protein